MMRRCSRLPGLAVVVVLTVVAAPTLAASQNDSKPKRLDKFFTPPQDRDGLRAATTEPDPDLPNVLIIGDSISIGYTKPTIERLSGVANVRRVKANYGDTNAGVRNLTRWLGDTQWDIIHFNWGLHDLCYRHPDSKVQEHRDKIHGTIAVPLEQYEKNLRTLVQRLKET